MKYDWNEQAGRTEVDGYSRGVAVGEGIMMAHVKLDEGAITKGHRHDFEEIIYVVSGRWKIFYADREIVVGANQSLVIPANVEHSSVAEADTIAVVCTNYRPDWNNNQDFWLHYNQEKHLWAV
jgi:quercetin dioxygenase-like cupin family protein